MLIKNRKSTKNSKITTGQTTMYIMLHRKLKIGSHASHKKLGFNSGDPEGLAVAAPPVLLVVALLQRKKTL